MSPDSLPSAADLLNAGARALEAEARHQKQLRELLTLLQGAHDALPGGEVPRAAVDCLLGMAEAYLLRALDKGGAA